MFQIEVSAVQASFDSHVRRHGGSAGGTQAVLLALRRFGEVRKVRVGRAGARTNHYEFGGLAGWRARFEEEFGLKIDGDPSAEVISLQEARRKA